MIRYVLLGAALVAIAAALIVTPRIPQDPAYHQFADVRSCGPVHNCLNVLSNLPFAFVGLLGLAAVLRPRASSFADSWERWPYVALFAGTALTAVGSSYYHLAPDNARLVWDRMPMTIGFMGFLSAVIAERIGTREARRLFVPLLMFGAASVVHWHWTEVRGAGDLRWYGLVQFGSLLATVLLLALYPPRYSHTAYVVAGLAAYGLAKLLELADDAILEATGIISGHSLKHLAAAAGVACILAAVRYRRPLN